VTRCALAWLTQHELVETGNTVVVIEHNLEVIKTADWLIDLGPEGGDGGGEIVAAGAPEEVVKVERSYTGRFLKAVLGRREEGRKRRTEELCAEVGDGMKG
jgi:excinuclease ABC subunit A